VHEVKLSHRRSWQLKDKNDSWSRAVAPDRTVIAFVSRGGLRVTDGSGRLRWQQRHLAAQGLPCTAACHIDGNGRLWGVLASGSTASTGSDRCL
jgi:hypothetical protein